MVGAAAQRGRSAVGEFARKPPRRYQGHASPSRSRVPIPVRSGGVASAASRAHRLVQRQHLLRLRRPAGAAPPCRSPPPCRPTTASTGTCARLCSRTLALIFWLVRSSSTASPAVAQRRRHLARIVVGVRDDRRHHRLHRRQPEREAAGIVLDQRCRGSARSCPGWRGAASPGVWRAPSSPTYSASSRSGMHEVDLQRAALPVAADRVAQHEFQLRAVEGALARVQRRTRRRRWRRPPAARPRRGPRPRRRRPAPAGGRRTSRGTRGSRNRGRSRTAARRTATVSAAICSSVQKMCASSWVKARTRMMPCSAPDGS